MERGLVLGTVGSVDVLPCPAGHDRADSDLMDVEHAGKALLRILLLSPPLFARVRRVKASYFPNLVLRQERSRIGLTPKSVSLRAMTTYCEPTKLVLIELATLSSLGDVPIPLV